MTEKRIVLKTTTGRFTGQYQILGTAGQLKQLHATMQWPPVVTPVQFRDHRGSAKFVRVGKSYVLYEETTEVANGMGQPTQSNPSA